ncbi:hypothetical protein BVC80_9077g100 [Macleaya cordata]|uniref:Uncharacterized protein n=1 Tax=Macleaya cordata TaxID=56857 RepID=A0A200PLS4_MACCD|nr:hypothetical protein BVC80_9077g100 [Macleaya cordata]
MGLAMGDTAIKIDDSKLISYCDDLVGVLSNKKDINNLMQSLEGVKLLQSFGEVDSSEVQNSLEVYQKKINNCQQRINVAKSEVVDDSDLDSLQKELEEELKMETSLQEELR